MHTSVYKQFLDLVVTSTKAMRQGAPIKDGQAESIDLGAINLPGLTDRIQWLVEDAVMDGAKVHA